MKNKILSTIMIIFLMVSSLTIVFAKVELNDPVPYEPPCTHNYQSFDSPSETYRHSWASCTDAARFYKKCTSCGEMAPKTYANTFTVGYALGHDYEDATCTKPKTCSRCNGTTGNALGHTSTTWKSDEDGINKLNHYKECSRCGKYDEGAHTVSSWTLGTTAISGRMDYHTGTCTVCGLVAREKCNSDGVAPFTLSNDGYHRIVCDVCGRTMSNAPHEYTGGKSDAAPHTCSVAGCGHKHSTAPRHYFPELTAGEGMPATINCGVAQCSETISLEGSFKNLTGLIVEDYVASDASIAMDPVPELKPEKYTLQWQYSDRNNSCIDNDSWWFADFKSTRSSGWLDNCRVLA